MAYCDRAELADYLNFSAGSQSPIKAGVCPFVQDAGAGMELAVFSVFVFGGVGLALTVRTQHPGPILVAGILVAGAVALSLPGLAAQVFALVLFFGLTALGMYLYQRARTSL